MLKGHTDKINPKRIIMISERVTSVIASIDDHQPSVLAKLPEKFTVKGLFVLVAIADAGFEGFPVMWATCEVGHV